MSLCFKFKLGNEEGERKEREAKPFKAAKPQLHQGMNNSLCAPGRTSHHWGWMEWTTKTRRNFIRAEDQAFPASKPPDVMRHINFDVHHNKKYLFHPFWGSSVKLTDRNNISKTLLCSGGESLA